MQTGDIVIVSFPYTDLASFKARPAVVIRQTSDKHKDVIVTLISSIVPYALSPYQILLQPNAINNLRALSIIKIERMATVEKEKVLTVIGRLNDRELTEFKKLYKSLVD